MILEQTEAQQRGIGRYLRTSADDARGACQTHNASSRYQRGDVVSHTRPIGCVLRTNLAPHHEPDDGSPTDHIPTLEQSRGEVSCQKALDFSKPFDGACAGCWSIHHYSSLRCMRRSYHAHPTCARPINWNHGQVQCKIWSRTIVTCFLAWLAQQRRPMTATDVGNRFVIGNGHAL
jgi:hypothetical protein